MLSIRRRHGPIGFDERPAYGGPRQGWPRWGDVGPILLQSAGIVGLAGTIVAVVSSGAFFDTDGPERQPSQASAVAAAIATPAVAVAMTLDEEPAPAPLQSSTVATTSVPTVRSAGSPTPSFSGRSGTFAPAPGVFTLPSAGALAPPPPASVASPPTPTQPPALAAPPPVETQVADLSAPSAEPPTPDPVVAPQAAVAVATIVPDLRAAPEATPAEPLDLGTQAPDLRAEPTLWADDAEECPRDWVADASDAQQVPPGCEPTESLLATVEPAAAHALEDAAIDHAAELGVILPRIPVPRPEPPPDAIVQSAPRSSRGSDWPAEPPPDCGELHAYWHFVDRSTGQKEWYCR